MKYLKVIFSILFLGLSFSVFATSFGEVHEASVGRLSIKGGLHLVLGLSEISDLRGSSIALQLRHRVQFINGHYQTVWDVPQLQTYILPARANQIRIKPPGEQEMLSSVPLIDNSFKCIIGSEWWLRRCSDDYYEVASYDGICYCFNRGSLVKIRLATGAVLNVLSKGAQIIQITMQSGQGDILLMNSEFSVLGRIEKILINGENIYFKYIGNNLASIYENEKESIYEFRYKFDLLSEVKSSDGSIDFNFLWKIGERGKLNSGEPTLDLLSDGKFIYKYTVHSIDGIVIEKASEKYGVIKVCFNPLIGTLSKVDNGRPIVNKKAKFTITELGAIKNLEVKDILLESDKKYLRDKTMDKPVQLEAIFP